MDLILFILANSSMPTLILMRHSTKDGEDGVSLGARGFALARKTGAALRRFAFRRFYISSMWRSTETLAAMAEGAKTFHIIDNPPVSPLHSLSERDTRTLSLWSGPCHDAEARGDDMLRAALDAEPTLVADLARAGAAAVVSMAADLGEQEVALCIGHSPMIEIAVRGLGVVVQQQLAPCEGVLLVLEHGRVVHSEEIRATPASAAPTGPTRREVDRPLRGRLAA